MREHPQRRWPRRVAIAVGAVVVVCVLVRLLLDPVAARATRKGLDQMDGFRGDFERVHVTLFAPGITITRLKLVEEPGGSWKTPIFFAESVHVGIDGRSLLRGRIVATARLVEPKISVAQRSTPKAKATKPSPDLSRQLQDVVPLKLARIEIVRGELVFRDLTAPRRPELWVHRLELAAENLPTREKLAGARPVTLNARGVVGRSGELTLFASADPFASPLAFAGRFEIVGLRVAELYDFIEPKTKLQTPRGTLDLFAEFTAKAGRVRGGVKPVLKNVDVRPVESGAWDKLKAWLADTAVEVASDRVPERNAVATVVPIDGRLTEPDVQLWPAIFGVMRNAFVEGLTSGFAHLPPPKAEEKQSVLEQAKEALDKEKGPPKAQPAKSK